MRGSIRGLFQGFYCLHQAPSREGSLTRVLVSPYKGTVNYWRLSVLVQCSISKRPLFFARLFSGLRLSLAKALPRLMSVATAEVMVLMYSLTIVQARTILNVITIPHMGTEIPTQAKGGLRFAASTNLADNRHQVVDASWCCWA